MNKTKKVLLILVGILCFSSALMADTGSVAKFKITLGEEAQSFDIEASTVREVNLKCKEYVADQVRDVFGEISVQSYKTKRVVKNRATQWWKNRNEICSVIAESTKTLGLPLGTPWTHLIQGLLQDSYEFVFYGNSKAEIKRQCEGFLDNRATHGPFDEAVFGYNFGKLHYVSTQSWWTEVDGEFCDLLLESVVD